MMMVKSLLHDVASFNLIQFKGLKNASSMTKLSRKATENIKIRTLKQNFVSNYICYNLSTVKTQVLI